MFPNKHVSFALLSWSDNYHHDNVYAMIGQAIGYYDAPMLDGHEDKFYNNKVRIVCTLNCDIRPAAVHSTRLVR